MSTQIITSDMELPHDWKQTLNDGYKLRWIIESERSIIYPDNIFPLNYTITLSKSRRMPSYILNTKIKFPENYPDTDLKRFDDTEFFHLSLIFNINEDSVYVSGFYNNVQIHSNVATREELKGLKGIGSEAFCIIFNFLVKYKFITLNAEVILVAAAGECIDFEIQNKLKQFSRNEMIDMYLKPHPVNYNQYLNNPKDDHLIELVCRIIQVRKLINYYIKLGFQIKDNSSGTGTEMKANVQNILDKC